MPQTSPDEDLLWLIFWAGLLTLVGLIAWEILRGSQGPPKGPGVLKVPVVKKKEQEAHRGPEGP